MSEFEVAPAVPSLFIAMVACIGLLVIAVAAYRLRTGTGSVANRLHHWSVHLFHLLFAACVWLLVMNGREFGTIDGALRAPLQFMLILVFSLANQIATVVLILLIGMAVLKFRRGRTGSQAMRTVAPPAPINTQFVARVLAVAMLCVGVVYAWYNTPFFFTVKQCANTTAAVGVTACSPLESFLNTWTPLLLPVLILLAAASGFLLLLAGLQRLLRRFASLRSVFSRHSGPRWLYAFALAGGSLMLVGQYVLMSVGCAAVRDSAMACGYSVFPSLLNTIALVLFALLAAAAILWALGAAIASRSQNASKNRAARYAVTAVRTVATKDILPRATLKKLLPPPSFYRTRLFRWGVALLLLALVAAVAMVVYVASSNGRQDKELTSLEVAFLQVQSKWQRVPGVNQVLRGNGCPKDATRPDDGTVPCFNHLAVRNISVRDEREMVTTVNNLHSGLMTVPELQDVPGVSSMYIDYTALQTKAKQTPYKLTTQKKDFDFKLRDNKEAACKGEYSLSTAHSPPSAFQANPTDITNLHLTLRCDLQIRSRLPFFWEQW
ncbi:hypothetical protein JNJ66_00125 [Candidatus Saccharibacteria bacterium]|nr:hypothetical protein [Candidatus Saccharibacteria bacterium]